MIKTSLLHRGLSVAYFSYKVHSWVGGLECLLDAKVWICTLNQSGQGDQNGENITFTPWAKPCLFQLQSALLGRWLGVDFRCKSILLHFGSIRPGGTKMAKTSLLHRGLSLAYFSSKVHSWVGGLE